MTRLHALAALIAACERLDHDLVACRNLKCGEPDCTFVRALIALRASPPLAEDGELVRELRLAVVSWLDADTRSVLEAIDARLAATPKTEER